MELSQTKIQFVKEEKTAENERAFRIALQMSEEHTLLNKIYENLVDREFKIATKDINTVIFHLRQTLKAIEEDDF